MVASAQAGLDFSRSRDLLDRVMTFRPALPLWVLGVVVTVLAFTWAAWFSPADYNATLADTHRLFLGEPLAPLAVQ